ncbi:MAG: hypothetical protein AAF146_17825, partial [Bacteroidota bacterium]
SPSAPMVLPLGGRVGRRQPNIYNIYNIYDIAPQKGTQPKGLQTRSPFFFFIFLLPIAPLLLSPAPFSNSILAFIYRPAPLPSIF